MTNIQKLDVKTLPPYGVYIFTGRSNSGKTLLMRDLMAHKCRSFKKALVMTGSANSALDFAEHIPDCFIYNDFREDILEQAVAKQERDRLLNKLTPLLVVLDDLGYVSQVCYPALQVGPGLPRGDRGTCLGVVICFVLLSLADCFFFLFSRQHIKSCKVIKQIFFNGRHAKILLLLSTQYSKSFPPEFRSNVNHVFVTYEKNYANRLHIMEAFNSIFKDKEAWDKAFTTITPGYRAMVLDNISNVSMAIEDNVFWYKANFPPLQWKINNGSGSIWRYHSNRYDKQYFMRPKPPPVQTGKKKAGTAAPVYQIVGNRKPAARR